MLQDEARLAARLNHQNVVQTLEVGEVDEQIFLAMEFLDGQAVPSHSQARPALLSQGAPVHGPVRCAQRECTTPTS